TPERVRICEIAGLSALALQPVRKSHDRSGRHDDLVDLADLFAGQVLAHIAAMNLRDLILGTFVMTDHFQNRIRVDAGVVAGLNEEAPERMKSQLALSFLRDAPFAAMRIEEVGIIMHLWRTLCLALDVRGPIRKRLFVALLALVLPEIEKADVDELLVDRHNKPHRPFPHRRTWRPSSSPTPEPMGRRA